MNIKASVCKTIPVFAFLALGVFGVTAQAPLFKYNVDYICNKEKAAGTERVVVRYCRRDSDKPGWPATTDGDNYCHVEFLDQPTNMPDVPMFKAILQTEITTKLAACKDPATGKPPAGAATAAATTAAADASIAKAVAAKIDISIVGMKFGDPLRLANCPLLMLGPPTQNCFASEMDMAKQVAKDFGMNDTFPEDVRVVNLSKDHCPDWVTGCQAYVTAHNGKLDGVALFTNGRNSATGVTRNLTTKYGKPTRVLSGTVEPDTGNKFDINEPEWDLPGLKVRYEIVLRNDGDGERIKTNQGIVRIMTEDEYNRRIKKEKEPVKNKL